MASTSITRWVTACVEKTARRQNCFIEGGYLWIDHEFAISPSTWKIAKRLLSTTKTSLSWRKRNVVRTAPITRLYAIPPGTPKDRVRTLQKSFMDTMKDPEFLAEAKKSNLEIESTSGEEAGKAIDSLFHLEPALVAKMKTILLGD
jgi:hypothetical protein